MSVVTEPNMSHRISGKPKVAVTRRLLPANQARMSELFDVALNMDDTPMSRESLVAAMQDCDVLVPTVTDVIDSEMIASAGERLGLIANFGAGYEHIDMDAANTREIMVSNTPGVFSEDTADLTMALIILATRRFGAAARDLYDGKWKGWAPSELLGHSLHNKVLAIVGMGRIGQAVARRAKAFNLGIAYHNRHRLHRELEEQLGARYEPDLDKLIAEADILTLHCPAGPETDNILNAKRIASMKVSAYVVNTARGSLIDEQALTAALAEDRLGGAGLDVYDREPDVNPKLLQLPNVISLPHLGSATFEGREEAGNKVIANIKAWADGHRPPDQVLSDLG
ncbi:MAG: D-glycerate dehydrogenase [Sphingomonadaceae bacterium]|nr:D-glycerate dehydrogenase [Sphingomonadaceae bacterium]